MYENVPGQSRCEKRIIHLPSSQNKSLFCDVMYHMGFVNSAIIEACCSRVPRCPRTYFVLKYVIKIVLDIVDRSPHRFPCAWLPDLQCMGSEQLSHEPPSRSPPQRCACTPSTDIHMTCCPSQYGAEQRAGPYATSVQTSVGTSAIHSWRAWVPYAQSNDAIWTQLWE